MRPSKSTNKFQHAAGDFYMNNSNPSKMQKIPPIESLWAGHFFHRVENLRIMGTYLLNHDFLKYEEPDFLCNLEINWTQNQIQDICHAALSMLEFDKLLNANKEKSYSFLKQLRRLYPHVFDTLNVLIGRLEIWSNKGCYDGTKSSLIEWISIWLIDVLSKGVMMNESNQEHATRLCSYVSKRLKTIFK